jgi:hypothetical protein
VGTGICSIRAAAPAIERSYEAFIAWRHTHDNGRMRL